MQTSQDAHGHSGPRTAQPSNLFHQFPVSTCNPAISSHLKVLQTCLFQLPLNILAFSSVCHLPSGSSIHFPSFPFSVLYYRELTPAKHSARLPCPGNGRKGQETGVQEEGKNQGIFFHSFYATGSFPGSACCVSSMVPAPGKHTLP